jgi:hypothetical protein
MSGWQDECESEDAVNRIGFSTRWCGIDREFVCRPVHPFCPSFCTRYTMRVNEEASLQIKHLALEISNWDIVTESSCVSAILIL